MFISKAKFCLITLFSLTLLVFTKNQLFSQSYSTWPNYLYLSTNGFLDKSSYGVNSKIKVVVNQGEPKFDGSEYIDEDKEVSIRLPRIYRKSNNKYILIWNDTKDRITKNEYDFMIQMGINTFQVGNENDIYGVIDTLDQFILPMKYRSIESVDPYLYYFEDGKEGEINFAPMTTHNLPVLFFECIESDGTINSQPRKIISRDGKVIIEDKSGGSISTYYFIKNKQIYHLFETYVNGNPAFHVSKLGETTSMSFEGNFSPAGLSVGSYDFIKDPLICGIERKGLIEFFDFNKMEYIKTIPPFRDFNYISSNFAKISNISKADSRTIVKSIISSEFKVIVPFDFGYEELEPLTQQHYDENELDENASRIDIIENQLSKDALMLFVKNIKDPKKGYTERMHGIHKIGVGTVVPPIYLHILRMTKNHCIVTFKEDNSQNILSLTTYKLLMPHNYDNIEFKQDGVGNSYFECLYEGKKEKYPISTSQ